MTYCLTMARLVGFALMAAFALSTAAAPLSVQLLTNKPSPQLVGTPVGLSAMVQNATQGMQVFQYSVSVNGGPFHIVRDFSQQKQFVWAPALYEHDVRLKVRVRHNQSKQTAESELPFRIVSRVKGNAAVITPTPNALVALFSAPPCPEGTQFRVAFRREGDENVMRTPALSCDPSHSNNVYVAGMRAETDYRMRAELTTGGKVKPGEWLSFRTGVLDGDFPAVSIPVPRTRKTAVSEPFLVHSVSALTSFKRPFATDLTGEVIWYSLLPQMLVRVLPDGRFLSYADGANSVNMVQRGQVLRESDLAGNTLHETNTGRVAEELERFGIHSDCRLGGKECVSGFHHEAIRLPNGHTMTLAGLERMFPAGTQGSKGPIDITGDLAIELDEDFQVTGVWNSFDHMDINRSASGEDNICPQGPGAGGCTAIFLAAAGAKEWLHSNALNYIPSTGDFLVSMPAQNWVVKVDWKNGKGRGNILWRLGEGGDFTAKSSDPHPWFSGQHDAGFHPGGDPTVLSLFDNGPARFAKDPRAHSRGQVWKLDERNNTAELIYNADLGEFSFAVGAAQPLKSGGYSFQLGFLNPASVYTRAVETSADGKVVYAQGLDGLVEYRSFRVADLYTAPGK